MEFYYRKIEKIGENIVNIAIPDIGIKHYPVWREADEDDAAFFGRAAEYSSELLRRHDAGEPYAIGYREWKDGKMHMVIRRVDKDGGSIFEKILGVDDDFVELGIDES